MSTNYSPHDLPVSKIPDFLEDRVIEILGQPEAERSEALRGLLESVPEHATAIRKWLEAALDTTREHDRELAETLGLFETKEPEPVRVGPYRILEPIGHGGMGSVYLAEQMELLRRRVALKLIKLGMDTREIIARFEAERQALAMMNHPNIARVYDAGVTEQGRPYFVMEYVPGVPITQYCDTHRLRLEERLELFIQVCDAVKHAHQRGVLHRDLKPSNVLVMRLDGRPVPKIIDFGVAKATNQRLTEKTIFTQQGRIIGTPEYMSPEQAETSGLEVDARTDVYSLGVVLYELLCGHLPFDRDRLRKAGLAEIHRIIREVEPPRPSQRVAGASSRAEGAAYHRRLGASALEKELRGSLDWITMTAMEKDPARRYPDADQLAADCARYLRNEHVLAGPPSSVYRVRTFLRRHRTVVRFTLGGVALLGISAWALTRKEGLLREATRTAESAAADLVAKDQQIDQLRAQLQRAQNELSGVRTKLEASRPAGGPTQEDIEKATRDLEQERLRTQRLETEVTEVQDQLARASMAGTRLLAVDGVVAQIERLLEEAPNLGLVSPAHCEAMRGWIERAKEAGTFGTELRGKLGADIDTIPQGARLAGLLDDLGDDDHGRIAAVRDNLRTALQYSELSTIEAAEAWKAAQGRVAAVADVGGRYGGIRLPLRAGLVPLGPDPVSQLEEFAFLPSGTVPQRDPRGKLVIDDDSAIVLVLLPTDSIDMGGSKVDPWQAEATPLAGPMSHPLRTVLLEAFYLGKYETTQGQWLRLLGADNPATFAAGQDVDGRRITARHPVESVSQARAGSMLVRWGLDLPTEAQWEYGARAGTHTTWWPGNDVGSLKGVANLLDRAGLDFGIGGGGARPSDNDGFAVHAPVGSFAPNPFGLHDVHGNVAEWCRDWLVDYDVEVMPGDGLARAETGRLRVHRGGSFADRPPIARSRHRGGDFPTTRSATIGVRVAMTLE
ncbi:MAG: SUMF1/EgtB/PvdO family nonheme iron enzyme [Planctomycetota bacterium]